MKLFNNRLGQSEVVSTVLLILITVMAIAIVGAFAIGFVQNQISKSKCFDVTNMIEIKNNPAYTCFNSTRSLVLVQVHFSDTQSLLEGFVIELGGADTNTFKILNNTAVTGVSMYSGGATLTLPLDNAEKTYNISGIASKPETIKVYPILKGGKVCSSSSNLNSVPNCP